jgi:hypothetical protein
MLGAAGGDHIDGDHATFSLSASPCTPSVPRGRYAASIRRISVAHILTVRRAAVTVIDTDGTVAGDRVYTYGNSSLQGGLSPLSPHTGFSLGDAKGRYEVASNLNMAGSWRFTVEWNGPAGKGSTSLAGTVS